MRYVARLVFRGGISEECDKTWGHLFEFQKSGHSAGKAMLMFTVAKWPGSWRWTGHMRTGELFLAGVTREVVRSPSPDLVTGNSKIGSICEGLFRG